MPGRGLLILLPPEYCCHVLSQSLAEMRFSNLVVYIAVATHDLYILNSLPQMGCDVFL